MPQNGVTEAAMDAAIKKNVKEAEDRMATRLRGMHEAVAFVKPWVGDMPLTYDSGEAVHRATLKVLGMDAASVDAIHADALRPIIESKPKPGAKPAGSAAERTVVQDAVGRASFAERFPAAAAINVINI